MITSEPTRFITNGEYSVRDKASGGMRRDSQRKALCAANPAPSPLEADLNVYHIVYVNHG